MIQIKEMAPRDGLQNEKVKILTEDKIEFIQKLQQAGITYIEIGAFVHPDKVPQMADTEAVIRGVDLQEGVETSVLVPNMHGFQKALDLGMKEVAVFTAASETFNQKNINASIQESLDRFKPVFEAAENNGIKVRGYISTAFVCPFEGLVSTNKVIPIIESLLEMGCYEVSIGDTIGKATTDQVTELFSKTHQLGLNGWLAGHFHDTYGQALENIKASLAFDIEVFDASAGGLGGCPYAPGAPGNVATEDVVDFLNSQNITLPIQINKLIEAISFIESKIGRELNSKTYKKYK
ncbi:MAG: hydroxymethylglutaryl-CoA lyase [Bdellovibrionales bacterium]|nr:hydroxymethylglutaryl-CoA lyase [Bdellovibrionales bacterium]